MRTIKKPDLNAPRFRKRRKSVLTSKTYKQFIEKYPEYSSLDLTMFKNIVMSFNANLVEGIIDNRNGVELPDGLGFIFMGTNIFSKTHLKNSRYAATLLCFTFYLAVKIR